MSTTTTPLPEAVGGAPAALSEAEVATDAMVRLADLAGDTAAWSGAERRALLQRLDRLVDGLSAVRAAVLVAERDSGAWQGNGDRSFEAWRSRTGRGAERSVMAQVRQAEQLGTVPSAAAAVTQGRISLEHAAVIAKIASTGTPAQRSAVCGADGQQHLLRLADELDAGTFAVTVARWASTIDPDALERDHEAQRRERFLHLADTPRGTLVKGRLDSMAGHRLRLALEALSPRPAADDDRDAGQRCADALDAMAGRILASAETKPGGHVPPQVSMILTAETWAAARAERDRRRGHGGPGDASEVDACHAPATLEDGAPVPAVEVAKVMCDCDITRVVIDADGVPLDLGRTQRLFTREQRRAVIARDRECVWPTCHLHARWCEVHHISWWERDAGPTSVDNGALLCAFHHHEVHRRDLTISRLVAASGPEPATRGGPGQRLVSVAYEFRDRTGRLVSSGLGVGPPGGGRPAWHATVPSGDRESGEVGLDRTTDVITGMRVPALLL